MDKHSTIALASSAHGSGADVTGGRYEEHQHSRGLRANSNLCQVSDSV